MFFTWIFSIISLVSLVVGKFFFVVSPDTNSLLLALALVASTPWIPLIFSHIKTDIEPIHSLTTRSAITWYGLLIFTWTILSFVLDTRTSTQIFFLILIFATYFHIDARIFFAVALGGLIVTVWSLVFDMSAWTESTSIIVYLSLVVGVLVELIAPVIGRFHRESKSLFHIPTAFIHEYRDTLGSYALLLSTGIGIVMVVLIVMRGIWWNYAFSMLLFFSMGYTLLIILRSLAQRRIPTLMDSIRDEYRLLTYLQNRSRYTSIWLLASLMILVDIAYFRALPWTTQSLMVLIGTVLLFLCVSLYPLISRTVKRYIDSSLL